jgi:hypothetical protein
MWMMLFSCREEPALTFEDVQRVVTLGDNLGSNPSANRSYLALLEANDDELFPEFAGKDLQTVLPDAEIVRLDQGGQSYYALADLIELDELVPEDERVTLVIVELGTNDLVSAALQLVSDPALRAEPGVLVERFREDVGTVLDATGDPEMLVVANMVDPSDGVGDLAQLVSAMFPVAGADEVTPELALSLLEGFDEVVRSEASARGAALVDLHSAFLGHGLHHDEPDSPHYDEEDPTLWLSTVVDPNLRGAHEIRRVLWEALAGEAVTVLPGELPMVEIEGLPPVPAEGWAEAVVEASLTESLTDEAGTVYPNVAALPEEALGEPTGGLTGGIVAIGIVGASLTLDLGVALDGEGDDLVVLELGALTGGTPEPYRLSVAQELDGAWVQVADGLGERSFDLGALGLAWARYVRLESLAPQADVLGGLGSPYYPGPEIDAVGAVYPEEP